MMMRETGNATNAFHSDSSWRSIRRTLSLMGIALGLMVNASLVQADPIPLFNGTTLDGWEQKGGVAVYTVDGGEIVGTSVPDTPNSFLCTKKHYQNFIFEADVKVDPVLNSGIQFRSNAYSEPRKYDVKDKDGNSKTIEVPAGRVHGYQAEIDPSERAWSGGIYDESRRGWLINPANDPKAQAAFKVNDWNHYKIEANGSHIRTWINGVPVSDLTDGMTGSGFIALQVHGIGKDESKVGKQIRWKNIKITELPASAGSKPWLHFEGKAGPGKGKKVVLVSGDEEYRSEEALPQLAKILSERHGFDTTVLFAIDPLTGFVNPSATDNIPGLEALETADLLILFTRFRKLPDEQMNILDQYFKSGKPVIGIRTATHAFNHPADSPWAHYANGYNGDKAEWKDGFGRLVLGERWHTHHGAHKHQSTRGVIAPDQGEHPVLKGIKNGDIWGSTDVYGVRLPLPGDSTPLVLGQVINRAGEFDGADLHFGMRPTDSELDLKKNDPLMPIVWVKSYQLPQGAAGKALTSTIGASADLENEGVRRVLVNGVYFLLGLEKEIPATGTNVEIVGEFKPSQYSSYTRDAWNQKGKTVSDYK